VEHEGSAAYARGVRHSSRVSGTAEVSHDDGRIVGECIVRAGLLLYADAVALQLLGLSAAEAVGRPVVDFLTPTDRVRVGRHLATCSETDWDRVALAPTPGLPSHLELRVQGQSGNGRKLVLLRHLVRVDAAAEGSEREDDREMRAGTDRSRTARVLICDDEARLASLTAGLLEEYGFEPITTGLGDEALGIVSRREPPVDVLLLDVNLSTGISARDLLRAVEARQGAPKVILTSGLAEEDVPEELRNHRSVAGYLAKPYSVEQLIECIRSALGRPEPNGSAG